MRKFCRLSCTVLCATLLAACATPPAGPHGAESAAAAPTRPAIDWAAVSGALAADLGKVGGISQQARPDGALLVRIPAAEGFASARAEPRPALVDTLERLVPILQAQPLAAVDVIGHTDSMGSELYNLRLSIARAEAVVEYLRSRGIALLRLSADGRGEAEPIADNGHADGLAANRRVELILRPLY